MPDSMDDVKTVWEELKDAKAEIARLEADGQELRRQLRIGDPHRPTREPAFKCKNCGAQEFFRGGWSASNYERQQDQFNRLHADCKLRGSVVMEALGFPADG